MCVYGASMFMFACVNVRNTHILSKVTNGTYTQHGGVCIYTYMQDVAMAAAEVALLLQASQSQHILSLAPGNPQASLSVHSLRG